MMNCWKNIIKSQISFNKGFDCKPIYNKRYLKTKIKSMQFFMMMECQKKVLIF